MPGEPQVISGAAALVPVAAALARAGRLDDAEQWLARLVAAQPAPDAAILRRLGQVQAQLGRREAAEASLRRALRIDPTDAAAQAALDALAPGVARRRVVAMGLSFAGVAALALVATQAWRGGTPLPAPPPSTFTQDPAPAAPPPPAPPPVAAPDPVSIEARRAAIEAYARLVSDLSRDERLAPLAVRLAGAEAPLPVQLAGPVATEHVRGLLREHAARHPALRIDAAGVAVAARYTVRPGDTLVSIARRLYGRADAWRPIWRANRGVLVAPGRLAPGLVLTLP